MNGAFWATIVVPGVSIRLGRFKLSSFDGQHSRPGTPPCTTPSPRQFADLAGRYDFVPGVFGDFLSDALTPVTAFPVADDGGPGVA